MASRHSSWWIGWWSLTATRVHSIRCSPTTVWPSPTSTSSDKEKRIGGRISQNRPQYHRNTTLNFGPGGKRLFLQAHGWSQTPVNSSTTSSPGIVPEGVARRSACGIIPGREINRAGGGIRLRSERPSSVAILGAEDRWSLRTPPLTLPPALKPHGTVPDPSETRTPQ